MGTVFYSDTASGHGAAGNLADALNWWTTSGATVPLGRVPTTGDTPRLLTGTDASSGAILSSLTTNGLANAAISGTASFAKITSLGTDTATFSGGSVSGNFADSGAALNVESGSFAGTCTFSGTEIDGGTFSGYLNITGGGISGGTFTGSAYLGGLPVTGGTFNCPVNNGLTNLISNATFNGAFIDNNTPETQYAGTVTFNGPYTGTYMEVAFPASGTTGTIIFNAPAIFTGGVNFSPGNYTILFNAPWSPDGGTTWYYPSPRSPFLKPGAM